MSEVVVSRATYVTVYVVLMFLTVLTTAVAYFDLGFANPVVALSIAIVKGTLVVLFFMHMRWNTKLMWVVGGAAIFWLGIMFVLSLGDYLTRGWAWY